MLKRAFDIAASAIGLTLLSPVLIVVALLIKRDSRGPVFFRQTRVGRHETYFRIYKFRTMYVDGGKNARSITVGDDPRITPVGRFLRRTKLDELPQLLNVLKGDMSIVGPRPEVPEYVAVYTPGDRETIFQVRPGITDEASIAFRNEAALLATASDPIAFYKEDVLPKKCQMAVEYVKNQSFVGDLKIIAKTLRALLFRD